MFQMRLHGPLRDAEHRATSGTPPMSMIIISTRSSAGVR
jgi:hypothetical protein